MTSDVADDLSTFGELGSFREPVVSVSSFPLGADIFPSSPVCTSVVSLSSGAEGASGASGILVDSTASGADDASAALV